jgi:LacI family transcriptional regulator
MGRIAQQGSVSIVDVARASGVSTSTVSRILTKHPRVRPSTRLRVETAIRELGYRPNALARSLLSGRTYTLGLVTYGLHNPFFGLLAYGVEVAARARGYSLLVGDSEDIAQQAECLTMFADRRVDGVLVAPLQDPAEELAVLRGADIKVVLLTCTAGEVPVSSVGVDDVRASKEATLHLLSLGHRRIGFLGTRRMIPGVRERLHGFHLAHQQIGVDVDADLVIQDLGDMNAVHAAIGQLLDLSVPPTAILAVNDEFAIVVLQEMHRRNRRVPEDIALVGFDDIPVAAWLGVPLTTVAQPIEGIGRIAANLLIDQIEQPGAPVQHILLDAHLVVRQSCGGSRHTMV